MSNRRNCIDLGTSVEIGQTHYHHPNRLFWAKNVCGLDSFSLSLRHQLGALETALCLNKLQQLVFSTILVLQDFSLFLDLTYSSNVLSITCILCKTVTSASRTLVIT